MNTFRSKILTGVKLVALVALLLGIGVSLSDELKIPLANQLFPYPVAVKVVGEIPEAQADSIIERLKAASSLAIQPAHVLDRECKQSPWCGSLDFKLNLIPKLLELTVHASLPEFVVDYGNERWLVSERGELIQTVSSIQDTSISYAAADLPLIQFGASSLPAGAVSSASACARATIAAAPTDIHFEQFHVDGDADLRAISSGSDFPPILVDCRKPDLLREQIARALRVAKDLQARGEISQSLDLRTQNQIIVK